MFPLHDDIPSERFPFVNYAIIVVTVLAWFLELAQGERIEDFFQASSRRSARCSCTAAGCI